MPTAQRLLLPVAGPGPVAYSSIVVPEGANPGKVAAMQGIGAEVIFYYEVR